jgi:predicted nucleotidyltransferase
MDNARDIYSGIQAELDSLVEKIKSRISTQKIILFGSYAYGTPEASSDIDLCVITDDKRRKIEILWDIQEAIYNTSPHSVDIVVVKPDEFIDRADSIATIEKTIAHKGIVLYG